MRSLPPETLARLQQVYTILDQQVATLMAETPDHIQCRKGCSHCCSAGFKIRPVEALYLQHGFKEASPEIQSEIQAHLSEVGRTTCPVLINGACSLYQHRPALCRAYGVIIEVDQTISCCPLNFQSLNFQNLSFQSLPHNQTVQKLALDPFYEVLSDLSQESNTGTDIPPRLTITEAIKAI